MSFYKTFENLENTDPILKNLYVYNPELNINNKY